MNLRTGISRFVVLSMTILLELAAFYSVIVIISQYILRQPTLYTVGLIWIGGMVGIAITLLMRTEHRWLRWLCILLAGGLISVISAQDSIVINVLITGLVVTIISFRGSILCTRDWQLAFPQMHQLAGIGCTLVLSMFSSKLSLTPVEAGSLYIAGVVSISSWLLRLNSEQVNRELLSTNPPKGPLRGFVKVNRRWSIITLVVMLFVGAFTQLTQGFYWLWIQFVSWLNGILSNMNEPVTENIAPEPEMMDNPFILDGDSIKEAGPSIWMNMMYWIIGILLVVVIVFAVYRLVRLVLQKLRELLARFEVKDGLTRKQSDHITYMDKVEKIEVKQRVRIFRRKKNRLPEDMDGKVRYYYQSMVRTAIDQGLVYSTSQTPNEVALEIQETQETPGAQVQKNKGSKLSPTAVQDVTSLYNEVRYGGKVIEERQLDSVIDRLKK